MNAALETQALFAKLSVGEASILFGVELVPLLLSESDNQADALLLEGGIASGQTQVNEVGESGVVGQVRILHRGGVPLLVLQGDPRAQAEACERLHSRHRHVRLEALQRSPSKTRSADAVCAALRELGSAEPTRMRSPTNSKTLSGTSGGVSYAAAVCHCAAAG